MTALDYDMNPAAKRHDANYAAFVVTMLACLAAEEADIARRNVTLYVSSSTDTTAATARPAK